MFAWIWNDEMIENFREFIKAIDRRYLERKSSGWDDLKKCEIACGYCGMHPTSTKYEELFEKILDSREHYILCVACMSFMDVQVKRQNDIVCPCDYYIDENGTPIALTILGKKLKEK